MHVLKENQNDLLSYWNSEKIGEIPNNFFSLIITTTITNFNESGILIHGKSSCDIMYTELLKKIGLKIKHMWLNDGDGLQAFSVWMV